MKKSFRGVIYIIFAAFTGGILFSACSSSKLEDVWQNKQYNFGNIKDVMVISAIENNAQRQMWEDSFVKEFSKNGIKAEPSYKIYPKEMPKPDEISKLVDKKYDGVVLVREINDNTGNVELKDGDYQVPVGWIHYSLYNRYKKVYKNALKKDQFRNNQLVKYNVGLYKANDTGDLIWEGTGELEIPVTKNALTKEFKNVVIPDMMGQKTTHG